MVSLGLQFQLRCQFSSIVLETGNDLSVLPFVLVLFPIIYNGLIRATISEFSSIFLKDRL